MNYHIRHYHVTCVIKTLDDGRSLDFLEVDAYDAADAAAQAVIAVNNKIRSRLEEYQAHGIYESLVGVQEVRPRIDWNEKKLGYDPTT